MDATATDAVTNWSLEPTAAAARRLLVEDLAPLQFFEELLKSFAIESGQLDLLAGVWMAGPAQSMTLFADHGFQASGLLKDRRQFQSNQELLLKGWQTQTPVLLELNSLAADARSPHQCLLIPMFKGEQRIGVIQILTQGLAWPDSDASDSPDLAASNEIMEVVNRYLYRAEESTRALDPGTFQSVFAVFCSQLHQSLDLSTVAVTGVTETCARLGCERAWLFERRGGQWTLRAVSGQKKLRQSSSQVRRIKTLIRLIAPVGRRFVFAGQEIDAPEKVIQALMAYLQDSGVQTLVLEPVVLPASIKKQERASEESRPIAFLVCEQFQDNLPAPGLLHHLPVWSEQIALALKNARDHSRLLLLPGMKQLSQMYDGVRASTLITSLLLLFSLVMVVTGTVIGQADLQIQSRGHLMPVVRRHVYAPLEGDVAELYVRTSEQVTAGQPILRLRSSQLELNQLMLGSQLQEKLQSRDAIRAGLRTSLAGRDRVDSARLQAQLESIAFEINALERRLAILAEEQTKLIVTAPINGTITTPQLEARLINRPVQRGEALIEIMDEHGPWHVELDIPERRAGHVLNQLKGDVRPSVVFRLTARPEREWHSHISKLGDRTALSSEYGTVMNAYCEVDVTELPVQRIGADVSAKIRCGQHSLLFVYFGETLEFLQRQWWF